MNERDREGRERLGGRDWRRGKGRSRMGEEGRGGGEEEEEHEGVCHHFTVFFPSAHTHVGGLGGRGRQWRGGGGGGEEGRRLKEVGLPMNYVSRALVAQALPRVAAPSSGTALARHKPGLNSSPAA